VLFTHPQIAEATVIAKPDPIWGEEVLALVVPVPGASPTEEEIIEYCRQRLADYKLPREVRFRTDLPKTLTGKVQKKLLKEELFGGGAEGR
jgi:acyl-CoA synthetase (AMP-forming)/AMP-acid ligase II